LNSEEKISFDKLMVWKEDEKILTFYFEASYESWKGSPDPLEHEKNWSLFKTDRTPKKVVQHTSKE